MALQFNDITEIFALRMSLIQFSWIGYHSTRIVAFMDKLITDLIYSPPELQNVYTEKLAFTNQTIFVVDHKLIMALIQYSWFGYHSTSIAAFMDKLITDLIYSPPELQNIYTEKIAFTNQTIFVVDHKQM
ncbi:hypothetical protein QTP88_007395 [Uroleucon formosanum]